MHIAASLTVLEAVVVIAVAVSFYQKAWIFLWVGVHLYIGNTSNYKTGYRADTLST